MCSVFRFCEGLDNGREIHDLDMLRALGPVVTPTDNHVATIQGMPMITEVSAFKFKFDPNALPPAGRDLSLCLAVGKARLDSLDHVTELSRDYSKEKNNAVLVRRFVTEAAKVYGASVCLAVT